MNQFEQVDFDHVKITFSHEELCYLQNDLLGRILEIKHKVLGEEVVDYSLADKSGPTEGQRKTLEAHGFYDRIALLRRIQEIESECFPDITTSI